MLPMRRKVGVITVGGAVFREVIALQRNGGVPYCAVTVEYSVIHCDAFEYFCYTAVQKRILRAAIKNGVEGD